jgi:hypothetical protein
MTHHIAADPQAARAPRTLFAPRRASSATAYTPQPMAASGTPGLDAPIGRDERHE